MRDRKCYAMFVLVLKFIVYSVIVFGICFICSPLMRLYILSYLGDSDAMYHLADEYATQSSKVVFRQDGYRRDYWIRRSANKGNIDAIRFIDIAWGRVNPHEVVFWLQKGVEFDHPWCAEQLARGYHFGLYELKIDPLKEAKYREIGARLRARGKGAPGE